MTTNVGGMLRDWREDRRRSQLDLALDVGVSTRHLSFVETGKAKPSPELVLALAEHLEVPLRERNTMLLAAGYAPRYPQTPLDDDVAGHRPSARSASCSGLTTRTRPSSSTVSGTSSCRTPARRCSSTGWPSTSSLPANSYRITLHPEGMASRIENFAEWAHHLLSTLHRQVAVTRDPRLRDLLEEVSAYPERRQPRRHVAHARRHPGRGRSRCATASVTPCSRGSRRTRRSEHPSTSRSTSCTSSCSTPPTRRPRRSSAAGRRRASPWRPRRCG